MSETLTEKDVSHMNDKKHNSLVYILNRKFEEFIAYFPEYFHEELKNTCYFAGGCIYSLWNGQEPKDWDVFCTSQDTIKRVVKWFKRTNNFTFLTDYAVTFKEFQIIISFIGTPEKVVSEFDFMHNMFFYRFDNSNIDCLSDWKYLDTNRLKFNNGRARDISSTITRIPKFVSRGMTISRTEVASMLEEMTKFSSIRKERKCISKIRKRRRY